MRLSTLSLIAVVATLVVGIIPALVAQAEIAAPGLQVVPQDDPGLYNFLTLVHGAAWSLPLALAAIALCLLQASESARLPMLRIVGLLALLACPVAFAVAILAGIGRNWALYQSLRDGMSTAAGVLLVATLTLAVVQQNARLAVIGLSALSLLAIGYGLLATLILNNPGTDNYLRDTHATLAIDHAFGVSIILSALAGVSGWIAKSRGIRTVLASLISGVAIAATSYVALGATFATGLMGMPRAYADYPSQFAAPLGLVSLWSFALAAAVTAGFVWLLSNLRHKPAPGPEEAFD